MRPISTQPFYSVTLSKQTINSASTQESGISASFRQRALNLRPKWRKYPSTHVSSHNCGLIVSISIDNGIEDVSQHLSLSRSTNGVTQ